MVSQLVSYNINCILSYTNKIESNVNITIEKQAYLVLGSMVYFLESLWSDIGPNDGKRLNRDSRSTMTANSDWISCSSELLTSHHFRIIHAASNTEMKPRAHPVPWGQKGCKKIVIDVKIWYTVICTMYHRGCFCQIWQREWGPTHYICCRWPRNTPMLCIFIIFYFTFSVF